MDCLSHVMTTMDMNRTHLDGQDYTNYSDFSNGQSASDVAQRQAFNQVRFYCYQVLIPIVLCFGIVGNAVCVSVLCRKRLRHTFDEVEQSATSGLVCLALSDMAFCVFGLLSVFMPSSTTVVEETNPWAVVGIYYNNYKEAMLNIFSLTSTWLIISISVARYIAISDPFKSRVSGSPRNMKIVHSLIFALAVLVNIPQFLRYQIARISCSEGCFCYYRKPGFFYDVSWYYCVWHVLGTLLPLVILVYCNCRLICQIYKSLHGTPHRYSTSKITVILVSIITLFLLLVCPSMILTFLIQVVGYESRTPFPFRIAITVTNLMQCINFAINFVLYSAISKQFRQTLINSICRRSTTKVSSKTPVRFHMVVVKGPHKFKTELV